MAWETLIRFANGTEVLVRKITPKKDTSPAIFAPLADSAGTALVTSGVEVSS